MQLLEPYEHTHPNIVRAWAKTLAYLDRRGEYDVLNGCLRQLRANVGAMRDVKDMTCIQMGLLLAIST